MWTLWVSLEKQTRRFLQGPFVGSPCHEGYNGLRSEWGAPSLWKLLRWVQGFPRNHLDLSLYIGLNLGFRSLGFFFHYLIF